MSNVFNVTRLAGARALVQGTDEGESTILYTEEFDELKGNTALKEAEADFDTKVKEFFAPVVEASEAFEQAKKAALTVNDPAFRVVVKEAIEATAGQTERVRIVQRDTAILRLIESGDTSRLLWVYGSIEITEL